MPTRSDYKRRRKDCKPPVSARLVLPDHVKNDIGSISTDLFAELFPQRKSNKNTIDNDSKIHYIVITPWSPNASPTASPWSLVPVTMSVELAPNTVQFSPSSSALQPFAKTLQQVAPSKLSSNIRTGIDVLVLDAVALHLDTVFVKLESELTKRLENGQGTFFREHPSHQGRGASPASQTPQQKLETALRYALSGLRVIHSGDLFPLPLPPHPVTHVPTNPGEILLCEPVAQGILSPDTKIILRRGRVQTPKRGRNPTAMPASRGQLNGVVEDDEEDTDNQFYSAAEERERGDISMTDGMESSTDLETDAPSGTDHDFEDDDEISDDSLDDIIALEAPMLPSTTTASGATTPMAMRGRKTNGISTPGSVFSSYTATTARPDRQRGRLFKSSALTHTIPEALLHPKPAPHDDDEARIYVDIMSLSKIGCFSGDWVRAEAAPDSAVTGLGVLSLGGFPDLDMAEPNWRPVRVFSLPESFGARPVTRIPSAKYEGRRLSFFDSQIQKPASPAAYISPILLANLDNAPYLRLSPLKKSLYTGKGTLPKFTSASRPPDARSVSIRQIRAPLSTEAAYTTAVMGAAKSYFARKVRLLRPGDLVAVSVDASLGKAMQESASNGESEINDVMALANASARISDVAWFKVEHIAAKKTDDSGFVNGHTEGIWGSIACMDSASTVLNMSGFETSRIPGVKDSPWPYYLGMKRLPIPASTIENGPVALPDTPYVSPTRRKLRELIAASTTQRAIALNMPPVAILLVSTHRAIGKATVAAAACADIGIHSFPIDCYDVLSESGGSGGDVKTEGFLRARADRAISCGISSCALVLKHIESLTAERISSSLKEILSELRVLIATTTEIDKVPDSVRGLFTHELELNAPDEAERETILRSIINDRGVGLDPSVDLSSVALKTAALVAGDLVDVVDRATMAKTIRLESVSAAQTKVQNTTVTVRDIYVAGGSFSRCLLRSDFDLAVDAVRKNFADAIGAPKIPNVTWDDVGGMANVKDAITETIQLPLERPELFARGMKKRSGILFYGPPGTGKTLLAKAIATEYSLNFFSVKGPELLNMYIGESEANVRRVFQRARDARPCVVFFDELDSVAPKRGNQGDSGGVMDRIVSQLLAELDGMSGGEDTSGVFVIGATNRPDLLDAALLRPGRFDKLLYLGVSDTHDKQMTILQALTRKFTIDPSVSLRSITEKLPLTYTGADFYALCSDAMLKAVTRQATLVDTKIRALSATAGKPVTTAAFFDHHATPSDIAVVVTEADFLAAHQELVPSVSAGELAHYERVRAQFEGGVNTAVKTAEHSTPGPTVQSPPPSGDVANATGTLTAPLLNLPLLIGGDRGSGYASSTSTATLRGKGKAIDYGSDSDRASPEKRFKGKGKMPINSGSIADGGSASGTSGFQNGGNSDDDELY
ncbi:peroxisomal assembly protein [Ceratocystis pirilliformis]|uniref:Peroxisomal ATPase PEX6 n=1 Tax=Ceratocystis pirilliformis TaxID=259994 RepID=A0ABR3Z4N6_9PEZI